MNRVIKFRVYILDNKGKVECCFHEWLDGDGWKHDYYAPIVCNGVFSHEELGDGFLGEIVRKQYIGLTDKNGVEIYEGDVIKFHYFYGTLGDGMGFVESEASLVGVVKFDEFGITVTDIKCKHWQELTGYEEREGESYIYQLYAMNESSVHEESFEVIGNIYENPELLNP